MKHLIFMAITTLAGTAGPLLWNRPYWGVAVYYLYAVLRPQWAWEWSLPVDLPWSFFVAVASMYAAVTQPGRNDDTGALGPPRYTTTHRIMLAFSLWITATYFTAHSMERAQPYFVEYAKIFIMFFAAARLITTPRQAWTVYLIVTGTLGYIACEVNQIYFVQHYTILFKRGWGGIDNNGAGLMLAMGIPLCLCAWEAIRKWYGWIFIALTPLLLHAVMMSYSRGAMLSLLVTLPLYVLRTRRRMALLIILIGAGTAVPVLAGHEIRERFFSISETDTDHSAQSRRTSWAIGWKMALERPILGFGIRNSNLFTRAYGADMEGRTIHSQYLQTAADSGLVALALYLLLMGSAWRACSRVRRTLSARNDEEAQRICAMCTGLQGSLAVFCFGAIFLSLENFELPYILLLLGAQLPSLVDGPVSLAEPFQSAETRETSDAGRAPALGVVACNPLTANGTS